MHIGLGLRLGDTGLTDSLLDDADVPLLLNPALYDSVQRVVPNRSRLSARTAIAVGNGANACAGPTFGTDKYGQCVAVDQSITTAHVSTTIPTLTSANAWVMEGSVVSPLTGAYVVLATISGVSDVVRLSSSGYFHFYDGTTIHGSASKVSTLLGIDFDINKWEWQIVLDGTSLDVNVRKPGDTWTAAISGATIDGAVHLSGRTLTTGSASIPAGFYRGKIYSLQVRDGGPTDPIVASLPVDPSVYDTLADGGAATDAHGVEWTIERPAADTSAATFDTDHFTSDGVNDFMQVIGDDSITDFDPAVGLTIVLDGNVPVADSGGVVASSANASTDDGVIVSMNSTNPRIQGRVDDGTTVATVGDNADNITFGTRFQAAFAFGSADHEAYVAGVSVESATDNVTAETAAGALRFFGEIDGSNPLAADLYGAAVIRRRITDDEAATIATEGLFA